MGKVRVERYGEGKKNFRLIGGRGEVLYSCRFTGEKRAILYNEAVKNLGKINKIYEINPSVRFTGCRSYGREGCMQVGVGGSGSNLSSRVSLSPGAVLGGLLTYYQPRLVDWVAEVERSGKVDVGEFEDRVVFDSPVRVIPIRKGNDRFILILDGFRKVFYTLKNGIEVDMREASGVLNRVAFIYDS